ncbi:MAG: hypothetical protein MUO60_01255 [Clostridiaceae bacterium]|nr:hypothetical protein [Clostridiaceae bacterium]
MNNPVILIAFPLLFAFLSAIFKKVDKTLLGIGLVVNILSLFMVNLGSYNIGGWQAPFGINLVLDNYSYLGVILVNIIIAIAVIFSTKEIKKMPTVVLIIIAALNGMLLTGDLFNLYVFMEIASIAAYLLASMNGKYKESFHYLVAGTLGSGLYLLGIIILYGIFGTLNIADLQNKITGSGVNEAVLTVPLVFIFIGLSVETKLLPFNSWVKGVYGHANGFTGAIFASAYAGATILVFGRVISNIFHMSSGLQNIFLTLAVVTYVFGELAAFAQKSLRQILLFSSVAQSGLILSLFILHFNYVAIILLVNNIVSKLILFTTAGKLATEAGTDEVNALAGIFQKHKGIGFGFSVACLSMMGLPVFFGFYAKVTTLFNLFKGNNLWLPAIILLISVVEGVYFVRMLVKLWNPGQEGVEATIEQVTSRTLKETTKLGIIATVLGLLIICAGIFPSVIQGNVVKAANDLGQNIPTYFIQLTGGMK